MTTQSDMVRKLIYQCISSSCSWKQHGDIVPQAPVRCPQCNLPVVVLFKRFRTEVTTNGAA